MKDSTYRPQYENSAALVIGVNAYVHAGPLANACADAKSVAQVLRVELGFPQAQVIMLLDGEATKARIMECFLAFDSLSPNDRLLVFFAGHGITVPSHRGPVGYLVPVDGRCEDKSTLIRWDELTRNADLIPAKHILFVIDACYSGLAMQRATGIGEKRFVSDMLQRRARQAITAGKDDEKVADGGGPTGNNSIFTGYLLEGLRGKAATSEGVLTASYLMNYVYEKVSNDSRSNQTPHFGHLDGDGDFILRTPGSGHLPGGTANDFLLNPVVERPEPPSTMSAASIEPLFAKKNGYSDPDSETFGRNEWSKKLGVFKRTDSREQLVRPLCWLSLIVEPVSNQPVSLDIASLAKTLRTFQSQGTKPHEQFKMPSQAITTAKSVILYEPDHGTEPTNEECWKRFLRIEKSGAIEYCNFTGVAGRYSTVKLAAGINVFKYVQAIGMIWTFLFAAKRILNLVNYQEGIRYLINFVGTKDSILAQFSSKPGEDNQKWREPFDMEAMTFGHSLQDWTCRDGNLQMPFQLVLGSLGEAEAKKLIVDCAEQLSLAYNHQSRPRCFNFNTDVFPWQQFDPHDG